jgi:hypothetical protein
LKTKQGEFHQARREEEGKLGAEIKGTVDNKISIDLKASEGFEQSMKQQYLEALARFADDQNVRFERWLQEANEAADRKISDATRKNNN